MNFCNLTANIRQRTAFVKSKDLPRGINCRTVRYETTTRTNWHYERVNAFAAKVRDRR